jgi:DeoR/GlpR family transcriptional regulator of sugar metabolism
MNGIHLEEGLTTSEPEDAAMKRILISRAADTYVMASIEKLDTVCAYKVAGFSEVAGIITDDPGDHPTVRQLHDDNDFATAAPFLPDLRERVIRDVPPAD